MEKKQYIMIIGFLLIVIFLIVGYYGVGKIQNYKTRILEESKIVGKTEGRIEGYNLLLGDICQDGLIDWKVDELTGQIIKYQISEVCSEFK